MVQKLPSLKRGSGIFKRMGIRDAGRQPPFRPIPSGRRLICAKNFEVDSQSRQREGKTEHYFFLCASRCKNNNYPYDKRTRVQIAFCLKERDLTYMYLLRGHENACNKIYDKWTGIRAGDMLFFVIRNNSHPCGCIYIAMAGILLSNV